MLVPTVCCAQALGERDVLSSDSSSDTIFDSRYLFRWRLHARADSY